MKIAIVMTYFNRPDQYERTIRSIFETAHPAEDYDIIVVDDGSDPSKMPRVHSDVITHIRIEPHEKSWKDVIPFNRGLKYALSLSPDLIMMQNAERYHVGDVISFAAKNVDGEHWISYACWALNRRDTLSGKYDLPRMIKNDDPYHTGWYNHPRWNPRYYHFCNAMTADNMRKLNGLDERFMNGRNCDDNDLVRRIVNLGLKIVTTDEHGPMVVHQWHPPSHRQELAVINERVYGQLRGEEPGNYRAQHILTEDF
jgi:GT2 family glycosyltransferase